jgi:transposase InsO family protein
VWRPWRRHSRGTLEIFNIDQGAQFTAADFTAVLLAKGVRASMDGNAPAASEPRRSHA